MNTGLVVLGVIALVTGGAMVFAAVHPGARRACEETLGELYSGGGPVYSPMGFAIGGSLIGALGGAIAIAGLIG